jgi:hypothetical protein
LHTSEHFFRVGPPEYEQAVKKSKVTAAKEMFRTRGLLVKPASTWSVKRERKESYVFSCFLLVEK